MTESHRAPPPVDPDPQPNSLDVPSVLTVYQEEVARVLSFRSSLDLTRNIAIGVVAGMALVVFGLPNASHLVLFFGSLAVFALALVETRTYRFAAVSEQRLRLIEQNHFAPALDPSLAPAPGWQDELARGFAHFALEVSFVEALAVRIKRNYFLIFFALDSCWVSKLYLSPAPALSVQEFLHRADLGFVPGLAVLSFLPFFWGSFIALIVWLIGKQSGREASY